MSILKRLINPVQWLKCMQWQKAHLKIWFFKWKARVLYPLGFYDNKFHSQPLDAYWESRIQDVIDSPDNARIPRHPLAGIIKGGKQTMHNGIVINVGGYYGGPIAQMLYRNKGVHEPQEEYVFEEVLQYIPANATMLELGAYWSFYSIWFHKKIKGAINFMVEPNRFNLEYGVNNFRLNAAKGNFTQAFVGSKAGMSEGIPVICVDDFVQQKGIGYLDILHSDIQGYEYQMLLGAKKTIAAKKIGYCFISTHGDEVHQQCIDFLTDHQFAILCSAGEKDTYSVDGLIVARAPHITGPGHIPISLKSKDGKQK